MTEVVTSLPDPLPTRMNLGCGYDLRKGYLNVDLQPKHSPDLVADVTRLPMLPPDHFEEILAQDVLEHLERAHTQPALDEWARLLKPNGVLVIRVPSLLDLFEMLSAPAWREFEKAQEVVHLMYGTQAYTGDFHLTGFTPALLDGYLRRAGLLICEANVRDGWLFDIRARKIGRLESAAEFVHGAYFRILGRPVDPSGLQDHCRALDAGEMTREDLETSLRNSDEGRFLTANPSYLVRHRTRLHDLPVSTALVRTARSAAGRLAARMGLKLPR